MDHINYKRKFFPSISLGILIPTIILSLTGILTLFSTTISPEGGYSDTEIVTKQILFVIIGLILYLIFSKIDTTYLKHWQILLITYLTVLILLILTLLIAPTINNVKRWLIIGGVQVQASEIAKFVVIILTAVIMSKRDKINEWILLAISFILTLPFVFLTYLQPDASMALLILMIWFIVAFLGLSKPLRNTLLLLILGFISSAFLLSSIMQDSRWYLLLIPAIILSIFLLYARNISKTLVISTIAVALVLGVTSSLLWDNILKEYQKDRVEAFFNPSTTEDDIGFNVNQARIAIGSGQIWGKGFGNGTQSKRDFLPEHQTDFIFASFAEEFGLAGSLLVISLYTIIILIALLTAMNTSDDPFISLLAIGIGMKILFEVFINIGTNTGTIPATGIPLPLMSAGGSITTITLMSLGLLQNIHNTISRKKKDGISEIVEFTDF